MLLIVILPLSFFVGVNSGSIISLFFGASYLPGSTVLAWLMASFSFLAVLIIHKTIITGCGFPRISSLLTLGLLPLGIFLQLMLVPNYGISGSAAAATVTFLCGSMASSIVVLHKFKAGFPLKSTLKISVAAGVMLCFNLILSRIGVTLVPNFLMSFTLYVLALRIVRVWKGSQLREFLGHFINSGEAA
jgi:O-antigen/teichoic acid export membrane protein